MYHFGCFQSQSFKFEMSLLGRFVGIGKEAEPDISKARSPADVQMFCKDVASLDLQEAIDKKGGAGLVVIKVASLVPRYSSFVSCIVLNQFHL